MCNVRYDSSWNIVDIDIDYLETLSCKERSATNDIGYACNFIVGLWMSFWNIPRGFVIEWRGSLY